MALHTRHIDVGQRRVERVFREVHVQVIGQRGQAGMRIDQRTQRAVFLVGDGLCLADQRRRSGQHLERVGVAAMGAHAVLDLFVEGLGAVQRIVAHEDGVGPLRREVPAAV
ncbi:hypothetical protein D3C85_1005740 [compost metagenome]